MGCSRRAAAGAMLALALQSPGAWAGSDFCPLLVSRRVWDEHSTQFWLEYEVSQNSLDGADAPQGFVSTRARLVPRDGGHFRWAEGTGFPAAEVERRFVSPQGSWIVPVHPQHKPKVPDATAVGPEVHMTASRSTVVRGGTPQLPYFGLKLPRSRYPQIDGTKAYVGSDITSSLDWTNWFTTLDSSAALRARPGVLLLRDVGAWVDSTGEGFIIRDLRPVTENVPRGHVWMPAFSVEKRFPHLSLDLDRQVAALNARMLLRYGYVPTTPHNQQYLVLLNTSSKTLGGPTAIRDLGDGRLYEPVARALGKTEAIEQESQSGHLLREFKHVRDPLIFREEVFRELGIPPVPEALDLFLSSPAGQAAIRRYHGLTP